jgi:hypothetical protein
MPVDLSYTVTGVSLDNYAGRLRNLDAPLKAIGVYAERLAKEALIRGETMGGDALAPLSPNTVAEKQLRGKGRGILRRDGALLASISYARTGAAEVQIGTNLEYAPWVMLGTAPRMIRPRKGKRLNFYTANGWRSARQVNHPGLPERNIFKGFEKKVGPFAEAAFLAYLEGG